MHVTTDGILFNNVVMYELIMGDAVYEMRHTHLILRSSPHSDAYIKINDRSDEAPHIDTHTP